MPRPLLWKSIADTLRTEITDRNYLPGERLPTEADLSRRFGVNRHTVRRALAQLAQEGLIVTRRGAGAFVATNVTEYPVGRRTRFAQNILAAGRTPARKFLRMETIRANSEESEELQVDEGEEIHLCEGLSLVDDVPVAVFRSVFPAGRFPLLLEHLKEDQSITAALRREGLPDYTRASTRLTALTATATQAQHLQMTAGGPLLLSRAINVDEAESPVEYGQTWFVGDRVLLTLSPEK